VAGPDGLAVGKIADQLDLANATLSFHLKELTNAGLTTATPNGRSIIYAANFKTMNELIGYLTENCCAGAACAPDQNARMQCRPAATMSPIASETPKKSLSTTKRSKS
jgi:hypothetical protein